MLIMSWERRGAERHSTGSRWAHRPTLAASTMVHLAVAYPAVGVENPTCCSACLFSKLDLNFCLKLTTLTTPNRSISLYLLPIHITPAPHMLETCLERLPQREIYPKPIQISTTEPSHHRNFHMYLSHMDGWRVPKASKQGGSLERLCDTWMTGLVAI